MDINFNVNEDWNVSDQVIEDRSYLQDVISYDEIVAKICDRATFEKFAPNNGLDDFFEPCSECPPAKRLVMIISVPYTVYDAFFNCAQGYRAAYYAAPEIGDKANSVIISALKSKLLDDVLRDAGFSIQETEKYLVPQYSKIWPDESEEPLKTVIHDCRLSEDLRAKRWYERAQTIQGNFPNDNLEKKMIWASHAPKGKRLKIMGAFTLNEGGTYIPQSKIFRAQQIHDIGFS